jgi:hypothetical protein
MFVAFMPPCIYFCNDVLLQIYSVSVKRPLLFKSVLDLFSKPKLCRSLFQNHCFPFLENIIGFKIRFKFDFDSKPYFEQKLRKALFLKSS